MVNTLEVVQLMNSRRRQTPPNIYCSDFDLSQPIERNISYFINVECLFEAIRRHLDKAVSSKK